MLEEVEDNAKGLFGDDDVLLDPLRMVEVAAWFAS